MYVIVGANGYLGNYIQKAILEDTKEDIICVDLKISNNSERVTWLECDITDKKSVNSLLEKLEKLDNIKIIYLAAFHKPDLVERNKELAWDINITSLSYFVNFAYFAKTIYYVSSDSVYGESINNYHFKENDNLNPVNFYGHNKCAAESIVYHLGRNIVRFPFLISPSLANKPHFYDEIVDSLKNNRKVQMYEDSYRSSLSFENAARLLVSLIENKNTHQIVNVCGDKDLSKYDVGILIAKKEKLDENLIEPISINTSVANFETKRASSTLMSNELLKNILHLDYVDIFDKPKYR